MDLGTVCGKPYTITTMAIVDAGESDIIGLV
jgi:large subunit ribosomal protein L30e